MLGTLTVLLLVLVVALIAATLPLEVLLGRLVWPANCTVPSLICIVRRLARVGAMTLLVPEISRVPPPDLTKLDEVIPPENCEAPVWPPRT